MPAVALFRSTVVAWVGIMPFAPRLLSAESFPSGRFTRRRPLHVPGGPAPLLASSRAILCRATMLRLFLSIFVASLLDAVTGCSGGADIGKGYNSKSGDLGGF